MEKLGVPIPLYSPLPFTLTIARAALCSMSPAQAVMYDYGNVSSSTTWYALSYIETAQGVAAGDKVLQIGVGSGIKCGVNVWQVRSRHLR